MTRGECFRCERPAVGTFSVLIHEPLASAVGVLDGHKLGPLPTCQKCQSYLARSVLELDESARITAPWDPAAVPRWNELLLEDVRGLLQPRLPEQAP